MGNALAVKINMFHEQNCAFTSLVFPCLFVFLTFCNITKLSPKYPVFSSVQDDIVINVPNV